MSCWKGLCVVDVCGDGIPQGSEECDDGDLDPDDGCTNHCEFTCLTTDPARDCSAGDECSGSMSCDDRTHTCSGAPLDDQTACDGGDGWCMKGICVPVDCGDGVAAGGEECDEGMDNGLPGSGCTLDCRVSAVCGNGLIEGSEQCDDGNQQRLDGCDADCRYELVHRTTRQLIVPDPPPAFCVHPGNRLGEAFATVELFAGVEFNFLTFFNDAFETQIEDGAKNTLLQVIDSGDTSMRTTDADISVGVYEAIPAETWQSGPPLDFPFLVDSDSVQGDRLPAPHHSVAALQMGGGRVLSAAPADIDMQGPFGEQRIYDFTMRTVFDVDQLSRPQDPPATAGSLELPETHGQGETGADPYRPAGTICGAIRGDALEEVPLQAVLADLCCRADGSTFRACEGGVVTDQCDSVRDLFQEGCLWCPDMQNPTAGSDCSRVSSGQCLQMMAPIAHDVDTDGNAENDAWSLVIAFEGKRVRVRGVSGQ